MIDISKISDELPYIKFVNLYKEALKSEQPNIEAICISSYDEIKHEPDSRFVNLKYIINDEWIFFSNYLSPKANQFKSCSSISAIFFWHESNIQIRLKADIKKTTSKFSDNYFEKRDKEKNILAITSKQSQRIESHEIFLNKYKKFAKDDTNFNSRPSYWGGYSFKPNYFEFWKGHEKRINIREIFKFENNKWNKFYLEP